MPRLKTSQRACFTYFAINGEICRFSINDDDVDEDEDGSATLTLAESNLSSGAHYGPPLWGWPRDSEHPAIR